MSDPEQARKTGAGVTPTGLTLVPLGDADAGVCVDGVCVLPPREAGEPTP